MIHAWHCSIWFLWISSFPSRFTCLSTILNIRRGCLTLLIICFRLELLLIHLLALSVSSILLGRISKGREIALTKLHSLALWPWHHVPLLLATLALLVVTRSLAPDRLIFLTSSVTVVIAPCFIILSRHSTLSTLLPIMVPLLTPLLTLIPRFYNKDRRNVSGKKGNFTYCIGVLHPGCFYFD